MKKIIFSLDVDSSLSSCLHRLVLKQVSTLPMLQRPLPSTTAADPVFMQAYSGACFKKIISFRTELSFPSKDMIIKRVPIPEM